MMPTKEEVMPKLMEWHFQVDPELVKVYRILSPNEDDPREPIKFLEVSPGTPSSGSVMAFGFGPTKDFPYRTVLATVTPEEMEQIERGEIPLPTGWDLSAVEDLTEMAMPVTHKNGNGTNGTGG